MCRPDRMSAAQRSQQCLRSCGWGTAPTAAQHDGLHPGLHSKLPPARPQDARKHALPGLQVGRTKIITLHSGMWLENCTDRRVAFRLHTPISPLVAPSADAGAAPAEARTDATIGPLGPDEGAQACTRCRV